ncbi:MAG: hypothetical protein WA761_04365 [Thermoplasmata archaeon]
MVYDFADQYVLLFSGSGPTADTWSFSNGTWTELTPSVEPSQRTYAGMVYDAKDGYVVMFGGHHGNTTAGFLNDTWTYRAGVWTNITDLSPARPHVRYGMAMAYDPADGYVVLFGGNFGNQPNTTIGDTWKFAAGTWTNITPEPVTKKDSPAARAFDGMAYDSMDGYLVLYGGWTPIGNRVLNDTWEFFGGVWKEVHPALSPPTAWYYMVTNQTNGSVLLFAPETDVVKSDDPVTQETWIYAGNDWQNLTLPASSINSTNTPPKRFGGGLAYDAKDGYAVLFGGLGGTLVREPVLGDTWVYNGTWTNISAPPLYLVTFSESGLLKGMTWNITIDGTTISSSAGTLRFDLPNGTFSYVGGVPGYPYASTGNVPVLGHPTAVKATFSGTAYPATFVEKGLSKGTPWSVTLFDDMGTSNGSSIKFELVNGSYAYSVEMVPGYSISDSADLNVSGAAVTQDVTFTAEGYTLRFTESGLPSHTPWNVTLTPGETVGSNGSSITFTVQNGSFTYAIAPIPGYLITTGSDCPTQCYSGSVTVNGEDPATIPVQWTPVKYPVTFRETGLVKTVWNVTIGSTTISTDAATHEFNLANGTHAFVITAARGYTARTNVTSPLSVNGGPVLVEVNFTYHSYLVSFVGSGLPSSDLWYVNITGGPSLVATGATTTQSTDLVNGSYTFHVGTNDTRYAPSYSPALTVSGEAVLISVNFTLLTDAVTIAETGLPSGTLWNTTVNGITFTTTNRTVLFQEANGTFDYRTGVPAGGSAAGTFTVDGGPISVHLAFYRISFTESKLPGSTTWQVTSNGVTVRSTGPLYFYLTNGTYSYHIGVVGGYRTTDSGAFAVTGAAMTIHSVFVRTTYSVRLSETGLSSGTDWCVTFNGTAECSTKGSISFSGVPNGTYSYTIGHVRNYALGTSYSGTVVVTGSGQGTTSNTVMVPWTLVKYLVKFTETGLPHGTDWSVTIAGQTRTTTGTSISLDLSNASYAFSITAPGYDPTANSSSPVIVDGVAVSISVTFTPAIPSVPADAPVAPAVRA